MKGFFEGSAVSALAVALATLAPSSQAVAAVAQDTAASSPDQQIASPAGAAATDAAAPNATAPEAAAPDAQPAPGAAAPAPQTAAAAAPVAQAAPAQPDAPDIIVTGVFSARAIERAPISINVVSAAQLAQQSPVSAADLLKNVPGVFVNSALGEIRNVVFSRGISANSLDGDGGYYYVSLQEDGLPVALAAASNFGPDYFLRPDLMLNRLEGLRGGTAAITGPNAPGGIFNYISRTGRSSPGVELQGKVGLEGDLKNPYYRIDGFAGGKLNDNGLYYAVGGFYRWDRGSRDPGYAMNRGGQIRGNLLWDYGRGSLLINAKYLDDRNAWYESIPAIGGTRIAPGFTDTSSVLPPANAVHCFPKVGGGNECWDPTNLVHARSGAIGANWKHDFGDGWSFENNLRYSRHRADWNTGAIIATIGITDGNYAQLQNIAGLPGTFNYYNRDTGQLVATVQSDGTAGGSRVTFNALPNQGIMMNGVLSQAAWVQHYKSDNFVDQATLTKSLGDHRLSAGGYIALANLSDRTEGGGLGMSTLTNRPAMLLVTYTDPAGGVQQVTDPSGYAALGAPLINSYHGTQKQFSGFFGDTWEVAERLTIDAGGRFEAIRYDISNQTYQSASSATGGADSNPVTLYDNHVSAFGPVNRVKRNYSFFNYSASASYDVSDSLNVYLRFTNGKKAPDFGTIVGINTPAQIATVFPSPQSIRQIELGMKLHQSGFDIQAFPFYSRLANVTAPQTFTYTSGSQTGRLYSPPPVAGTIETYGVEIAASARITSQLGARGNLTLQNPKARGFGSWTQGPKGDGTDDRVVEVPEGDADNNPRIITRAGLDWQPVEGLTLFGEANHIGKRAANAANAFYLPAYTTVDVGGTWKVSEGLKFQLNATNVFNTLGVMSWSRSGGFLASLDRQGLTKAAYSPQGIYPIVGIQPRAVFLTANATF